MPILQSQEVPRNQLTAKAAQCVEVFCRENQLQEIQDAATGEVVAILDLLPERVNSKRVFKKKCCYAASAVLERFSTETGVDRCILEKLQQDILSESNLLLDERYIEGIIQKIKEYCETHRCPQRWSLGSIRKWQSEDDKNFGMNFWQYWRNNIERNSDEKFRAKILPELPETWQQKYKKPVFCPYDWANMGEREIAGVLIGLKKIHDPSARTWGLGSIHRWTSEKGEKWGLSFYNFLIRSVHEDFDGYFRTRILPFLPESWQKTYETKEQIDCIYRWRNMDDRAIADVLQGLRKNYDPAKKRWGLGSIKYWTGENGERWGQSFYIFWHRNVESDGDKIFETRIVPLLPAAWQKTYRGKNYTVNFLPSGDGTRAVVLACNDIEELARLVHEERNPDAFTKLVVMLEVKIEERLPRGFPTVPVSLIERCVHNYIPYGDIVRYCVKAAFWRGFPYWRSFREANDDRGKINRAADYIREADHQTEKLAESIDQRSAELEDAFFSTAEFLDVDLAVLSELMDLAKRGISLQDIISGERYSSAVQDAAKKVRQVLAGYD